MPSATPSQVPHSHVPQATSFVSRESVVVARNSHEARADALTAGHRERKSRREKHPVEDFLHTYYPFSPAQLRRWHPGWEVEYDAVADQDRAGSQDIRSDVTRRWYADTPSGRRRADVAAFLEARGDAVAWIVWLLTNTSSKPMNLSCFGLHEWAMVYRLGPGEKRHESLPLRLGQEGTNRVVEESSLVCTHVDAYRFFTPAAAPLNASAPTRASQPMRENPACLHAGMDLYKWAMKLAPLIPSALALDCFEHARRIRVLDMEASPYDCRPLGYSVVPIETVQGREEYVRRQTKLAETSASLRKQLLAHLEPLEPLLPRVVLNGR